ncbi:MAG: chemotaxis protein CheW [Deltaproteobacteria bacterium]|nr:chemotaxis protein CheW [Deltaproteobacteria bacterium]
MARGVGDQEKRLEVDLRRDSGEVVVFRLGQGYYGLPSHTVRSVNPPRPIHSIPRRSSRLLRGLVAREGQLQLCISLHVLLAEKPEETTERRLIFVGGSGECGWAFEVDAMDEIIRTGGPQVNQELDLEHPLISHHLSLTERSVSVFDAERLLATFSRLTAATDSQDESSQDEHWSIE